MNASLSFQTPSVRPRLAPAAYLAGLCASWFGILFLRINDFCLDSGQGVILFSIVSVVQCVGFLIQVQRSDRTGFSGASLFLFSSAFFGSIMPALSVIVDYHFLIDPHEVVAVEQLTALAFWFNLAFVLGYYATSQGRPRQEVWRPNSSQSTLHAAYLALALGMLAMLSLLPILVLSLGSNYVDVSALLQGEGWVIRLTEFVALAGVLFFLVGKGTQRQRFIYLGLTCVLVFAIFRASFQNRENAVKYFVVLLLASHIYTPRAWSLKRTAGFFFGFAAVLFTLPLLSAIRGEASLDALFAAYQHFLFRDLNFSEVASALLADPERAGSIGIAAGLEHVATILVPRQLWEDKPFPIGALITSWVTPVVGYDLAKPQFAYAPMYIGFGYAVGGIGFVAVLAFSAGVLMRMVLRLANTARTSTRLFDICLVAIVAYYLGFAFLKVDPGIIIGAMILPLTYLAVARAFAKRAWLRRQRG